MPDTTTRAVKIGTQLGQGNTSWQQNRDAWTTADEAGLDMIFNCDHFFTSDEPSGSFFEAWMIVAAMAEATKHAQIGILVAGNSYRNPNLTADMARTCDHISGGRVVLGIGSGWAERDYTGYGYEFGTAASRLQDLKRDLPIIRERLGKLNPGPVHGTLPILIGGSGEKVTLRLVAEHADIWHCNGDLETIIHKSKVLDEWCQKVGRNPADIDHSANIGKDKFDRAADYVDAGFTTLIAGVPGPEFDVEPVVDLLGWRDARNAEIGAG